MAFRAAAEGRGLLPLAAVCLFAALLPSPTVEASRGLPAALAPALTSPSTADQVLEAELSNPPARLRLFDDLRLPPRPLELVEARKTATGFSTWNLGINSLQIGGLNQNRSGLSFQGQWTDPVTGISYARNRWYDARSASWLSEDPMGAVDSPNLYAAFGWAPHIYTDPMGNVLPKEALWDPETQLYKYEGRWYQVNEARIVWEIDLNRGAKHTRVTDAGVANAVRALAGASTNPNSAGVKLAQGVADRVTEEAVVKMAVGYWGVTAAPIAGYYGVSAANTAGYWLLTRAGWTITGGTWLANEAIEEVAGPGGVTPSLGVVDDAVSLVDEGIDAAQALVRRGENLVPPVLGTASEVVTEKLSREASDALRAEARDIWQQVTGRRAIWDDLQIHHRIPLEWSHLVSKADPNRLANLLGVDSATHTLITKEWAAWKKALDGRIPTQAEIVEQALKIEKQFSDAWVFPK